MSAVVYTVVYGTGSGKERYRGMEQCLDVAVLSRVLRGKSNEEQISRKTTLLIKARLFCLPKHANLYAARSAIRSSLAQASRHCLSCFPVTVQDEDHGGSAADRRDGQQRV